MLAPIVPIPTLKTLPLTNSPKTSLTTTKLYKLHRTQQDVFWNPSRYRVVVCGRRWGKSRLSLAIGILCALGKLPYRPVRSLEESPDPTIDMMQLPSGVWVPKSKPYVKFPYDPASPPVILFAMPTLKQCKKIFWKPLVNLLHSKPFVDSINRSDYTISLKGGLPDIVCVGLNDGDGDRVRGFRIGALLADEWQDVKPAIWEEVLQPAMADTPDSIALFTGTPKGKMNHLYKFDQRSYELDDWQAFNFVTADNPFVPEKEIAQAEATLDPRIFRQEYRASYEDFPGQIYDHLGDRHLISTLPETFDRCILGVDWGDVNPALAAVGVKSYWDGSEKRDRYYVLDTWYSDTGLNVLDHTLMGEAQTLISKWGIKYIYCGHDRPASIQKWDEHFAGQIYVCKSAFNAVSEGNNSVNGLLYHGNMLIAAHLKKFKEKMASYHRAQDKYGNFLDEPATGQDDHECLIAGTKITTLTGEKPIEEIAAGEMVLTRKGFKQVLWSGKTGVQKPVLTATFDNGAQITATKNHPIYIDQAWKPLDRLRYNDVCIVVIPVNHVCQSKETQKNLKRSYSTASNFVDTRTRLDVAIASIFAHLQNISKKGSDTFIEKYGSIILGKFRKAGLFTTKTKTHSTTTLATLNVFLLRLIQRCIVKLIGGLCLDRGDRTLKQFAKKQVSGIDLRRGESGIENMPKELRPISSYSSSLVSIAEKATRQSHLGKTGFVPIDADLRGDANPAKTLRLDNASTAHLASLPTDTQRHDFAHVRVVSIQPVGRQDVYNLMVDECPEFFANGILVHNCDGLRYAVATDIYENSNAGWIGDI